MSEQSEIIKALETAVGALRSFQYGNASEEFAESIADHCAKVLAAAKDVQSQPQMTGQDKRLNNPVGAIKYTLRLSQDDATDAIEFLRAWCEGDLKTLSEWDWDGAFKPRDF